MQLIGIVRDYERRIQQYREQRYEIINASHLPPDGMPKKRKISDTTFDKVAALEKLEKSYDIVSMRAVERAREEIGREIESREERGKLSMAIIDSCIYGRHFRFEYCDLRTCSQKRRKIVWQKEIVNHETSELVLTS